jgi:ATP-dependent RNA helicase DDX18/HAS1
LTKNYFLHQSAKDGFRSYLQAYASYSLKKIFDINALDLAKVGRSFGFAVPPRVNINIGGSQSTTPKGQRKRQRESEENEEVFEEIVPEAQVDGDEEGEEEDRHPQRSGRNEGQSKARRIETEGRKKVSKEIYRKKNNYSQKGTQWSR